MRRLLEGVRNGFREFVEQRDDLIALLACNDDDAPVAVKILGDLEQSADTDVFLLFADDFIAASPYVSVVVERLAEQHRLACQWAAEQGRAPLPQMPPDLFDDAQPPAHRLFDAVAFARSLVPERGGHRLVWAMCPSRMADPEAYLDLARTFLPRNGVEPWMRGLRLIFRTGSDVDSTAPDVVQGARVRMLPVDFGPAALQGSLQDEAEDEELPEDERMQSVLSLALLDASHDRTTDAAKKFESLLSYYQRTGNVAMQAFVINAFGDVYRKAGDLEGARDWYECAAVPAADAHDTLILSMVVRNLGDVAYERGKFEEAESYFDGLDQLAAHLLQPEAKVSALEWRGLSQEQQGAYDAAIESWEGAATLSRNIGLPALLRANLQHLQRAFQATSSGGRLAEVNAELRKLPAEEDQ